MRSDDKIKYIATAVTLIVFTWISLTQAIQGRILGVVFLALVLWSLYPQRHFETSLVIIAFLGLFEASLNVQEFIENIFITYGGSGLWIILSGFVLAKGIEVSGLGKRLALQIATSLGCKPKNILIAISIATLVISPLSPSTTAKAFLLLPICIGLIDAFGIKKGRSQFGAMVMLIAMASNNICSTAFLTATVPNPISAAYLEDSAGLVLDWFGWMRMALPVTILLIIVSYLILGRIFKPEVEATPETVEKIMKIRDNLGPLSRREIVVVIIFTLALLLWITEDVNPLNAGVISLLLSLMIFLPQAKVMEIGKFSSSIPWGSILLFAASLFLARSVSRYQALDPVATNIFNMLGLERLTPMFFIGSLVFVAMILHVIFTSTTVYATVMVPIVISLTQLQGISPALTALPIAFLAPVALFLPVNTIPNIVFFSEGWFNERQMALYGSLLSFASVAIVLLIGVPYWRFIGII